VEKATKALKSTTPAGMAAPNTFGELNLSVVGLGVHYPPYSLDAKAVETLAERFYPESPS
jgi:type III polyketide synthase